MSHSVKNRWKHCNSGTVTPASADAGLNQDDRSYSLCARDSLRSLPFTWLSVLDVMS